MLGSGVHVDEIYYPQVSKLDGFEFFMVSFSAILRFYVFNNVSHWLGVDGGNYIVH